MKKSNRFKFLTISLLAISVFSNCTFIGLYIGTGVAKKKHKERPSFPTEAVVFDSIAYDTWLDVFKKDGELVEGKFVKTETTIGENGIEQKVVVLNVMGPKKHTKVPQNDIDHVVFGYKTDGPAVLGMGIGLLTDLSLLIWLATELNNVFTTGH